MRISDDLYRVLVKYQQSLEIKATIPQLVHWLLNQAIISRAVEKVRRKLEEPPK